MNNKIINAGIRITKRCNLKCPYCNIPNEDVNELDIDQWKEALKIIKNLGVSDIVVLGGEPTLYKYIVEFIRYAENELNLRCSLTTNALNNLNTVKQLIDNGLSSIGVSVDSLELENSVSPLKAKMGRDLLNKLLELEVKCNIVNYVVLSKKNANSICDLITYYNNKGIYTYILPYHWGDEGDFEHRKKLDIFAFRTDEDVRLYNNVVDRIIKLKKEGLRIKNSLEFLESSKKYIKNLNWKCNGLSELRINSDGKMVCCCDKLGDVNSHLTIFDLPERLNEFYNLREKDSSKCKGCLWPSSFEAELKKVK